MSLRNEEQTFTTKDRLLHLAAQLEQIARELGSCQADPSYSLPANHSMGVAMGMIHYSAQRLIRIAGGGV
jgi:hypothetical protein